MATVDSLLIQGHRNTEPFELKNPPPKVNSAEDLSAVRKFFSFKNLQFEVIRKSTFKKWPVKFIDAGELAKNGFFYMQRDDFVQCHFCRGVIGYWEKGDDPKVEHEKHFPNCPFVQGSCVTNIPLDGTPVSKMLMKFLEDRMKDSEPPLRKRTYQTDSATEEKKTFQYPDYAGRDKRKASFPKGMKWNIPNEDDMVDAGLFLIGLGDMAQCYSCGGGIFNWSIDEDPKETHDSLYPNCHLARERRKHKEQGESDMEGVVSKRRKIQEDEKTLLMDLPVAKKLIVGGWPKKMVEDALAYELNKYGTLPVDISEGNDSLLDYEEMIDADEDEDEDFL